MFKKLKRKFILLNMIIISVVMMVSFTTIYFITFNDIQNQNRLRIENVSSTTMRYMEIYQNSSTINVQFPLDEYIQAFGVVIDEQGDYIFDSTFGTISKEFIQIAVDTAMKENTEIGKIVLGNRQYQYSIKQALAKVNSSEENSITTTSVERLYLLVFLDITESQQTIVQLLITFIIIGGLTLFVIFGISVYFAKCSIIPIEQAYKKQKQFIQDASHELKTPLAAIGANLDVIIATPKQTVESQQKWLGHISYEIQRMSKLVNDLLFLAKTENTDLVTESVPVNLSTVIEHSILSIETMIYEKGIELEQHIEPKMIVNGDEDKIEQIFNILLDNAIKYTNIGGKIDVILTNRKNEAKLIISNTGNGISDEHIDRIFDRFYRIDEARKDNGSYGLGLAIAKSLVEGMDGEIKVTSIMNEKTTFTVKFLCE